MRFAGKSIASGEEVLVRRDVGKPWERATYVGKVTGMNGWHRIELASEAVPVIVDSMTGMRLLEARGDRQYATRRIIVPSQRMSRATDTARKATP